MLSFIGIQPFTDKAAFDYWISGPVKQNRPDSLRRLQDLVRATCLRRTKALNYALFQLPQRTEKVELIELSPVDRELYSFFKIKTAEIVSELSQRQFGAGKAHQQKGINVLTLINFLRLICDHGEHLLPSSALEVWKTRSSGFTDQQMMRAFTARCDICGIHIDEFDLLALLDLDYQCQHSICSICAVQGQKDKACKGASCPKCMTEIASEEDRTISQIPRKFIRPSAKVEKLIHNLRQESGLESEGDQNLVPRKRQATSESRLKKDRAANPSVGQFGFQHLDQDA